MAKRLSMLVVAVLGTAWLLIGFIGKASGRAPAAGPRIAAAPVASAPSTAVKAIGQADVCATHGKGQWSGGRLHVTEPTFRMVAIGSRGDAARLRFVYQGDSQEVRRLASSQLRRQLGVKLRAMNGCNLVYVMWRLEPKPGLEVSVKHNPGARTNEDCGTRGYTKIRPQGSSPLPALNPGDAHTLQTEIVGNELVAWIDDRVVWRGDLGAEALDLMGPAGVRTDNVQVDIEEFSAPGNPAVDTKPKCDGAGSGD